MTNEIRNFPTAKLDERNPFQWNLTTIKENTIAYKLYYYLLTKSAIDWGQSKNGYNPVYFLTNSKKYWTKKEAAAELGCDPRSITNNLKRLEEVGLIKLVDGGKRYVFLKPSYWTPLHWNILKFFMALGDNANWVIMIRFYSVLAYAFENNVDSFTTTDIVKTLGISNNSHVFLRMCLTWWESLGLITYRIRTIRDRIFGEYPLYTIMRIETRSNNTIDDMLACGGPITESWQQCMTDTDKKLQTRES